MDRTIKPEVLKTQRTDALVLDVRRHNDYAACSEIIPGSVWKNPEQLDTTRFPAGDRVIAALR